MTTTKKTKPSWLVQRIVENYRRRVKGHEEFISEQMRYAILSEAIVSIMIAQYGNETQTRLDDLIDARGEAIDILFPEA